MRPPLLQGQRLPRLMAAMAILGILAFFAWLPKSSQMPVPSLCAVQSITGLPCPLCGGTRAARALLHGDIAQTIRLNALAIPALAAASILALLLTVEAVMGRALIDWNQFGRKACRGIPWMLIALILWWVPQILGALSGSKSELLDRNHPVARKLSEEFQKNN